MFHRRARNEAARTMKALRFVFIGPVLLAFFLAAQWMHMPGSIGFRWAMLGIGLAWVLSLFRVIKAIVLVGGLAAFAAYLAKRNMA
ncbi:MAG: hypothetical protein KDC27_04110 [Acidobacteria bacterium]|nr:hypothetical protein [Acidobacteriota bacterium]